ncbi:MAG: MBL fold metallo-hydrolase [bacterium]
MSKIYYLVGLVMGLSILVVAQMPSSQAKMVVCDVGQGDAILIIKGSNQTLIDGGPSSEKLLSCLGKYLPFWDRRIELIVLTNTDDDHINGLSAVVERYQVMQFVTGDGVHEGTGLVKLARELTRARVRVEMVEQGDSLRILGRDSIEFRVLWPPETKKEYSAVFSNQTDFVKREQILGASAKRGNLNERSVVLLLLEDKKKVLLMGDAGDQAEKEMLKQGILPDVDILKVGHHGSRYASTLEFLQVIKPELAVISAGAKNSYGHPTQETLDRLKMIGAEVKRTDQNGTIMLEL